MIIILDPAIGGDQLGLHNMFINILTSQLMILEGYSKIWQFEIQVAGWEWVGGWLVFAKNKDWQG